MTSVTLPKETVVLLYSFYKQYWHETSTYDIGSKNMSGLEYKDELVLDELAERIEPLELEIENALKVGDGNQSDSVLN